MNMSGARSQSIDLIKIISMSLVVCLHTVFLFVGEGVDLAFVLYNLGVIAIPLFFMTSGYLLLGREKASYTYSFKKIFGIFRFVAILACLWWLYTSICGGFVLRDLIIFLFGSFFQIGPFGVFWYLGAMCLIYLVYPVLNRLYSCPEWCVFVLFIFLGAQSIAFACNLVGDGERSVTQTFRLWNWLSYFMLGGLIRRLRFEGVQPIFLFAIAILVPVILWCMHWLYPHIGNDHCEYFYSNMLVVLLCCSVFILINGFKIEKNRIIAGVAGVFLPVYALHPFVVMYTSFLPPLLRSHCGQFGAIIYWLSVLSATAAISYLLMKIPPVKSIFKI